MYIYVCVCLLHRYLNGNDARVFIEKLMQFIYVLFEKVLSSPIRIATHLISDYITPHFLSSFEHIYSLLQFLSILVLKQYVLEGSALQGLTFVESVYVYVSDVVQSDEQLVDSLIFCYFWLYRMTLKQLSTFRIKQTSHFSNEKQLKRLIEAKHEFIFTKLIHQNKNPRDVLQLWHMTSLFNHVPSFYPSSRILKETLYSLRQKQIYRVHGIRSSQNIHTALLCDYSFSHHPVVISSSETEVSKQTSLTFSSKKVSGLLADQICSVSPFYGFPYPLWLCSSNETAQAAIDFAIQHQAYETAIDISFQCKQKEFTATLTTFENLEYLTNLGCIVDSVFVVLHNKLKEVRKQSAIDAQFIIDHIQVMNSFSFLYYLIIIGNC